MTAPTPDEIARRARDRELARRVEEWRNEDGLTGMRLADRELALWVANEYLPALSPTPQEAGG